MSNHTSFSWEFACPKFVDFTDSKVLELNGEEADAYFDKEHEFSFTSHNLSECLKVESLLAEVDSMVSPVVTPSRPASSASNYRTPDGENKSDLESDEVFYTTRKSYSLRETECRRLTQIGASPYRIPGGTTTGKKKSRRTPFQPKLVEENAKQIEEEELLVQNLVKALFLDDENDSSKQKDENDEPEPSNPEQAQGKENSQKMDKSVLMNVTQGSNDYSMELMAVSQDNVTECGASVCSDNDDSMSLESLKINEVDANILEKTIVEEVAVPVESTEVHPEAHPQVQPEVQSELTAKVAVEASEKEIYYSAHDLSYDINTETTETLNTKPYESEDTKESGPTEVIEQQKVETVVEVKEEAVDIKKEVVDVVENKDTEDKRVDADIQQNIPNIRVCPQINVKSASTSSDEGYSKSTHSDSCWTDVEDETVPGTSKTQDKPRRPLRRESFIKPTATLPSTVKKVDPQKRLYRLLSYTAPVRNKYRSLAELSRDFETKIRVYTPSNLKATKAQWTPTKPVSPKLTACKRKRTVTCVSHKQQEENIAQSIKKNTFKATPFNKKTYLSTVNVGVKRVDPKPTTKPIPFCFRSEKRIEARRSKVSADLFNKLTSESARKAK